jgi:hypothetical protein
MRLNDYYSRVVRDGRDGRPTIREVRAEYQRGLERRYSAYLHR